VLTFVNSVPYLIGTARVTITSVCKLAEKMPITFPLLLKTGPPLLPAPVEFTVS
jgi:hypothetical protein